MNQFQIRVRASRGLGHNRLSATTRSTEGIGIMTVTARNVGIQGRLARDPQFFPKSGEKEAVTYTRILNDEYAFDGKDAEGKSQFVKETVGYNLELSGGVAEAFAQTHKKGDLVLAIANRDEWSRENDGKSYENVTYHVKAIGDVLVPERSAATEGPTLEEIEQGLRAGIEAGSIVVPSQGREAVYADPTEPNFGPTAGQAAAPIAEMAQSIK
jgi:single-stranded DNA-binding protein